MSMRPYFEIRHDQEINYGAKILFGTFAGVVLTAALIEKFFGTSSVAELSPALWAILPSASITAGLVEHFDHEAEDFLA